MSFNMETDSDSSFSSAGSPCNNFNHCCLDFEDDPYRFKTFICLNCVFLGVFVEMIPRGNVHGQARLCKKKLSWRK